MSKKTIVNSRSENKRGFHRHYRKLDTQMALFLQSNIHKAKLSGTD